MTVAQLLCIGLISFGVSSQAMAGDISQKFKHDYAKLVSLNYQDALKDADHLEDRIEEFLDNPNSSTLESAKLAWLMSRNSYGQTEAFRFYEGPIDFVDPISGIEGPEGRLNSWPLDESYIDYVKGNPKAGIVNRGAKISETSLVKANQENDESQVSLGYHAIEFLLWGQDFSLSSAGNRSYEDYIKIEENKARRKYLKEVVEILEDDLEFLVKEWKDTKWNIFSANYARKFASLDDEIVLKKVLTSLATLSGFELASERMATALDSGDQEDEHSCFSDNTHNDFIYNQQGIKNVYLGDYKDFNGIGIYEVLQKKNAEMAEKILAHINKTEKLISHIPYPIDAKVLAAPKNSIGRMQMEKAVSALQEQAKLFLEAGNELGVEVQLISE